MFENAFELISNHMIHDSSLEDFPKVKKYNITKVRCQVLFENLCTDGHLIKPPGK